MRAAGISVLTTAVGDRYVLKAVWATDLSLGGEQSGHLVFSDAATTGDGLLTAVHVMARMVSSGATFAELAGVVHRLPQTLINVRVGDRAAVASSPAVVAAVAAVEADLGDARRVLLRPSGTEQLVRVMVVAATQRDTDAVAGHLAEVVSAT
jgi:phosphoglucosamine mutase